MSFEQLHLLIDFGLFIILWLVQLVIYPSFCRIDASQLTEWHRSYTFRVSFIIVPLMLAQLGFSIVAFASGPSLIDGCVLTLVVLTWVSTFVVSVPLHRRLEGGDRSLELCRALERTNWPRTALWSLIFLLGLAR